MVQRHDSAKVSVASYQPQGLVRDVGSNPVAGHLVRIATCASMLPRRKKDRFKTPVRSIGQRIEEADIKQIGRFENRKSDYTRDAELVERSCANCAE